MLTWPVLEGEQRKISAQKMAEDDVLEEERRGRQRRRTSEAEHEVHDELRTDVSSDLVLLIVCAR